jgi:DNA-3-methyladenine glycosylase II
VTPAERIREDAAAIVAADERFAGVDPDSLPIEVWGGGFGPLIHLILGQQVSIEAADAMYLNLERHIGPVTAQGLLTLDDDTLRSCGFTRMKAEYGRGLALAMLDGFDLAGLADAPDDAVVKSLTGLRGIGPWTAECYLIFCLGRRDVFPVGDLALRVGYQEVAGLAVQPTQPETEQYAAQWAPRRTAAAYLVWQTYLERRGRATSVPFSTSPSSARPRG